MKHVCCSCRGESSVPSTQVWATPVPGDQTSSSGFLPHLCGHMYKHVIQPGTHTQTHTHILKMKKIKKKKKRKKMSSSFPAYEELHNGYQ